MTRRFKQNYIPGQRRGTPSTQITAPPGVVGAWRGPNLLVDGYMEFVGVGSWAPTASVISKATVDPYEGIRYMRSINTSGSSGRFSQSSMVIGHNYRITGVARSVGGSLPRIWHGAWAWQGTSSTSWQLVDAAFTAVSAIIDMYSWGGGPGAGSEWDMLYLSEG